MQGVAVAQNNYRQLDKIIDGVAATVQYDDDERFMYIVQLDEADSLIAARDDIRY